MKWYVLTCVVLFVVALVCVMVFMDRPSMEGAPSIPMHAFM